MSCSWHHFPFCRCRNGTQQSRALLWQYISYIHSCEPWLLFAKTSVKYPVELVNALGASKTCMCLCCLVFPVSQPLGCRSRQKLSDPVCGPSLMDCCCAGCTRYRFNHLRRQQPCLPQLGQSIAQLGLSLTFITAFEHFISNVWSNLETGACSPIPAFQRHTTGPEFKSFLEWSRSSCSIQKQAGATVKHQTACGASKAFRRAFAA